MDIKQPLVVLRDKAMLFKSYLARSAGYVAIFNSGMLVFLSLVSLEKYGIDINMTVWGIPIAISGILMMVFIGYLEDYYGFWRQEVTVGNQRNPLLLEIRDEQRALRKEIESLKYGDDIRGNN